MDTNNPRASSDARGFCVSLLVIEQLLQKFLALLLLGNNHSPFAILLRNNHRDCFAIFFEGQQIESVAFIAPSPAA
jgi:hypothetical protein